MSTTLTYNEHDLVLSLKAKDQAAFSYLYDHYSGALYNIVLQIVNDGELARDVLQEAFVNIWRKIDSYDPQKGRLFTWMLNVTRNLSIDMLRSKGFQNSRKNAELNDVTEGYAPSVKQETDHIGLKKVVEKLKEEHRVLIDLSYFKGYTHDEISQMLEIPLGTVKTRIRSALLQMRQFMGSG